MRKLIEVGKVEKGRKPRKVTGWKKGRERGHGAAQPRALSRLDFHNQSPDRDSQEESGDDSEGIEKKEQKGAEYLIVTLGVIVDQH